MQTSPHKLFKSCLKKVYHLFIFRSGFWAILCSSSEGPQGARKETIRTAWPSHQALSGLPAGGSGPNLERRF